MTPVWGWSQPGDKVTVQIAAKTFTATADQYGRWLVRWSFRCGRAVDARDLGSQVGARSKTCSSVTSGCAAANPTWCSRSMRSLNGAAEIAASSFPQLRHFTVNERALKAPRQSLSGTTELGGGGAEHHRQPVGHLLLLRSLAPAKAESSDRAHRRGSWTARGARRGPAGPRWPPSRTSRPQWPRSRRGPIRFRTTT